MNYVLLDADNVVVARSKVASAFGEAVEHTVLETEEWPEPGMVHENGEFSAPAVSLDRRRDRKRSEIMAERDRRIDAGFVFQGERYQSRAGDRENIAGAAQLATMALLIGGAAPGDLRWHGGATDFAFIAKDNSETPMDAPTVIVFAKTAAAMKSASIFHAKALKEQVDAAEDEADLEAIDVSAGWPA